MWETLHHLVLQVKENVMNHFQILFDPCLMRTQSVAVRIGAQSLITCVSLNYSSKINISLPQSTPFYEEDYEDRVALTRTRSYGTKDRQTSSERVAAVFEPMNRRTGDRRNKRPGERLANQHGLVLSFGNLLKKQKWPKAW